MNAPHPQTLVEIPYTLNNGEKVGAFEQKPTGSKRTPPKFWAAFSFAGDWR